LGGRPPVRNVGGGAGGLSARRLLGVPRRDPVQGHDRAALGGVMRRRVRVDAGLCARVRALLAARDEGRRPGVRPSIEVRAQADGATELLIYDEIGFWGINASDFAGVMAKVSGPLHVRVNSPGGDVFDGIAIYNMLADYPGEVTVIVDGLAASAASFIAQAGDRVRMNRGS